MEKDEQVDLEEARAWVNYVDSAPTREEWLRRLRESAVASPTPRSEKSA